MSEELTANRFVERLEEHRSDEQLEKIQRYFKTGDGEYGEGDVFIGVPMGQVFALAKEFIDMPPDQIESLLEDSVHEVRAGAVSVMDKQARRKRTPDERRKELYELYLRRHDRINNWDLVDLGAPHVIGGYLMDKPRDVLYELARSASLWERRTSIVATLYFIRHNDLDDAVRIAALLLDDEQDLIHKAAGMALREVGRRDRGRLLAFLDEHAAVMPRTMLRTAMEHLDKKTRDHYRSLGGTQARR
jgi:3-methyladenine DNA glycosylase AlkD